jgi:hypothetical protein
MGVGVNPPVHDGLRRLEEMADRALDKVKPLYTLYHDDVTGLAIDANADQLKSALYIIESLILHIDGLYTRVERLERDRA